MIDKHFSPQLHELCAALRRHGFADAQPWETGGHTHTAHATLETDARGRETVCIDLGDPANGEPFGASIAYLETETGFNATAPVAWNAEAWARLAFGFRDHVESMGTRSKPRGLQIERY